MDEFDSNNLEQLTDGLFGQYEELKADSAVTTEIKGHVAAALSRRRRRVVYLRMLSAAAVILVLISVSVMLPLRFDGPAESASAAIAVMSEGAWESESIIDDPEIAFVVEEIDNIVSQMYSIEFDFDNDSEYLELLDIETEVFELQNDFWKG